MELLETKILLEKYFEGTTTLEEERSLHLFLSAYKGSESELLEAKAIFAKNKEEQSSILNLDFYEFIVRSNEAKVKPTKFRRLYLVSSAIAASLVLFISIFSIHNSEEQIVYAYVNGQAITNEVEAIRYSHEAIKTMSTNFNKGTQNLSYMNQLNKPAALITAQ